MNLNRQINYIAWNFIAIENRSASITEMSSKIPITRTQYAHILNIVPHLIHDQSALNLTIITTTSTKASLDHIRAHAHRF